MICQCPPVMQEVGPGGGGGRTASGARSFQRIVNGEQLLHPLKLHQQAEALADAANLNETVESLSLSTVVSPTISMPQRPSAARAQFLPLAVGTGISPIALNFSVVGMFNREALSGMIVSVTGILIVNNTAGALNYNVRRLDVLTGFTLSNSVTPYSNAGPTTMASIGLAFRSDSAAQQGLLVLDGVPVRANGELFLPFKGIINNGAIIINPTTVNTRLDAYLFGETSPVRRFQAAG